jgi:hypothetical protein
MPYNVSTDVDTFLRSANNAAARTAISAASTTHASTHAPGGSDPLVGYAPAEVMTCLEPERITDGEFAQQVTVPSQVSGGINFGGVYTRVNAYRYEAPSGNYITYQQEEGYWYMFSSSGAFVAIAEGGGTGQPIPESWINYTTSQLFLIERDYVPFQAGQLVRVVDQGGRIERFLGGDALNNDNWLVLKNTVQLVVYAGSYDEVPMTINNVLMMSGENVNCGWVDPLDIRVASDGLGYTFDNVFIQNYSGPQNETPSFGVGVYGSYHNYPYTSFSLRMPSPPRGTILLSMDYLSGNFS